MFQENSIETGILSRVKQVTSPDWMHETSAQTWFTGKTQRDRVEREVGGGTGMGITCNSMADSRQCMTKTLQYCKEISLQLIKINGNKKREREAGCGKGWVSPAPSLWESEQYRPGLSVAHQFPNPTPHPPLLLGTNHRFLFSS